MLVDTFILSNTATLMLTGVLAGGISVYGTWLILKRVINRKEKTNQELIQYVRDLTTGGDGFSYVTLYPGTEEDVSVVLRNRSGFPIYGLHITITWEPMNGKATCESDQDHQPNSSLQQDSIQFRPIPEIPRYFHGMTIGKIKGRVNGIYTIVFDARNGCWVQKYSICKESDQSEKHSWTITKFVAGQERVLREEATEIKAQSVYM